MREGFSPVLREIFLLKCIIPLITVKYFVILVYFIFSGMSTENSSIFEINGKKSAVVSSAQSRNRR